MIQGLNLNIQKLCTPTKETGFLSNLPTATNIVVKNPVSRPRAQILTLLFSPLLEDFRYEAGVFNPRRTEFPII
jgi:hypothetical protein